MHIVAPTDVSCQPIGSSIDTSRKYSLILSAKQPTYCEGLEQRKSDYAPHIKSEIFWRRPFGASLQVDRLLRGGV